jgi:hypothetical protein
VRPVRRRSGQAFVFEDDGEFGNHSLRSVDDLLPLVTDLGGVQRFSASLARYEPPPIAMQPATASARPATRIGPRPGSAAAMPVTTPRGTSNPSWKPSTNSRIRDSRPIRAASPRACSSI